MLLGQQIPLFNFVIILMFTCFARVGFAQQITLAADVWCPINCEAVSNKPGYMVELAKMIFAPHGIQINYIQMPWSRAVKMARAGQFDGIIGAFKGDAPDFVFPKIPQAILTNNFYVLKTNSWHYNGVNSLATQVLGCIQGYDYGEVLNQYIQQHKGNNVIALTGNKDVLNRLIQLTEGQRVSVIVEVDYVFNFTIAKLNKQNLFKFAGSAGKPMPAYIAFSPNITRAKYYAEILSKGMKRLAESDEIIQLQQKYKLHKVSNK